jgi:N-acetylmuramoyl-L-alanine amidase
MLVACSTTHPAGALSQVTPPASPAGTGVASPVAHPGTRTVGNGAAPPVTVGRIATSPRDDLGPGSLAGQVIVLDPGHNGGNSRHAREIDRRVGIGNGTKACDTTGTQTVAGYTEAAFNLDVAGRLAALLRAAGAAVVLTRTTNTGAGPCIDVRAAIGNRAHAVAAVSIHADGAPPTGFGFHVIVPKGIGRNDAIVAPSRRLGLALRGAFQAGTGEPLSSYIGTSTGAVVARDDLGGLNLSTVPKVFIECGNMRNPADARRLSDPAWRQQAAHALALGFARYLMR